jgi:hypothetical protein
MAMQSVTDARQSACTSDGAMGVCSGPCTSVNEVAIFHVASSRRPPVDPSGILNALFLPDGS